MNDVKILLEELIKFEAGLEIDKTQHDGVPLVDISFLHGDTTAGREVASRMLSEAASGDMGAIDSEINSRGLKYSIYGTPYSVDTGVLVPLILNYVELPVGVFAIARTTDSGNGECLASKVSKCEECHVFFVCKTKRRSRFCTQSCRTEFVNRERRESGYFKKYYRDRLKPRS